MPLCPDCGSELEDDNLFNAFWCWKCDVVYSLTDDGLLVLHAPRRVTGVSVSGHLL